jgi:type VI secretion system protein VasG
VESGARNVDNILTNTLLPEVSRQVLGQLAEGQKAEAIRVGIGAAGALTITNVRTAAGYPSSVLL